jgi:aminoglycoside phosphotransferase (APT) family kinase protein
MKIDESLVARLLRGQFPQWRDLPLRPVPSAGTDNALYRLGDDLVVRLPRIPRAAPMIEKELRWLPYLAGRLPLDIPVPVGVGVPGEGFAFSWSVLRWLPGADAYTERFDLGDAAVRLGEFVAALQRVDPTGVPPASRGSGLRDDGTRQQIRDLDADGRLDGPAAMRLWDSVLMLPQADRPQWIHSDLMPANLLVRINRISAVIDFGGMGLGDPACDLMPAWTMLDAVTRPLFRRASGVDDRTWERGRGWALACGVGAMHHYRATNPPMAAMGAVAVAEVLS